MGKVILGFTLSLDGFAEDINHSVGLTFRGPSGSESQPRTISI